MRRLLPFMLVLISFVLLPWRTYSQSKSYGFYMGEFLILPDVQSAKVQGFSTDQNDTLREKLQRADNPSQVYSILKDRTLTGKGQCSVLGRLFPVSFVDVKVKLDQAKRALIAIQGVTRIVAGYHELLRIDIDNCQIQIPVSGISLDPIRATCNLVVKVPISIFATDLDTLTFRSSSAIFSNDSSICGTDFFCSDVFVPRQSPPFKIVFDGDHKNTIALGKRVLCEHSQISKGIWFSARAETDLVSFDVKGEINDEARLCNIHYALHDPVTLTPECGYVLVIKAGTIDYLCRAEVARATTVVGGFRLSRPDVPNTHRALQVLRGLTHLGNDTDITLSAVERARFALTRNSLGVVVGILVPEVSVTSSFEADVSLPEIVPNVGGTRIVLSNVTLQTDTNGALFGKKHVPPIYVGQNYLVSCSEDNSWLYFPEWWTKRDPIGHYGDCSNDVEYLRVCQKCILNDAFRQFDQFHRPGVTIFAGQFCFSAPQLTSPDILHTRFFGALTITNWGISGSLTSGGYSLVPKSMPDTMLFTTPVSSSLSTAMQAGNRPPAPPSILFQLSGIRIRNMVIDSIQFCSSKISSSSVRYLVHFPYPSYIDIAFQDITLDDNGLLHQASGPLQASRGANELNQLLCNEIQAWPYVDLRREAPQVLWFWRLPIMLFPNCVTIRLPASSNDHLEPIASITNGTIAILPLYSQSTLSGIFFSGSLTREGVFRVETTEKHVELSRSKLGGFDVTLDSIRLVDLTNQPVQRKFDYEWYGQVKLPFFGTKPVHFIAKNDTLESKVVCCLNDSQYLAHTGVYHSDTLSVKGKVQYNYIMNSFIGNYPQYKEWSTLPNGPFLKGKTLDINSYIEAFVRLQHATKRDIILQKDTTSLSSDCCIQNKVTMQVLRDFTEDDVDLICFDRQANQDRTERLGTDMCGERKLCGKYQIWSKVGTDSTLIFEADPATYYPSLRSYDLINARCQTYSDNPNAKPVSFDLPLATLVIDPVQGSISGDFSISLPSSGSSPFSAEVDIDFYVSTRCGFFYFYGRAAFQYYVGFTGEIFLCHAPYCIIAGCQSDGCNSPDGDPPLTKMAKFCSCRDVKTLGDEMFGASVSNGTIVNGFALGGGVDFSIGICDLNVGATAYYFETSGNHLGAWLFAKGTVNLIVVEAVVSADLHGSCTTESKEFTVGGDLYGCACLSALIGHLQASFTTSAEYSTASGLEFTSPSLDFEAGWGGCNCE